MKGDEILVGKIWWLGESVTMRRKGSPPPSFSTFLSFFLVVHVYLLPFPYLLS